MTTKIEKALSLGKTQGARKLLEEFYLAEDKANWLADRQAEYDILFKTKEVLVDEVQDEEGNIIEESYSYFDYVDDCVSFTDWLNETRVVSEEVEATYNEDGMELTPYQPEVNELVRPYVANDVTPLVDAYIGSKYAELRASAYPPMADYLDAVVKNDTVAIQEYIDACLAVKAKYPKA